MNYMELKNLLISLIITMFLFLPGCVSEEGSERPIPVIAPIDISGVWVGTWSGYDPELARNISGNWEADLEIDGTVVTGTGTLTGDVDCTDGIVYGSVDNSYVIFGELVREPCGINEWVITSLSLVNREVSGVWTKSSVGGEGSLSGVQVATSDGPKIRHVYPSGGPPGTIVSIIGERFEEDPDNNKLDFNGAAVQNIRILDDKHIIAEVPEDTVTGPLTIVTSNEEGAQVARSVLSFDAAVSYPKPEVINSTIDVSSYGSSGIVFTPNGRRAFIISPHHISMIDVASAEELGYSAYSGFSAQAIVASPNSKNVYVLTTNEILIIHAGLNTIEDRIALSNDRVTAHSPQSLAITPDGQHLLFSDHRPGGSVSVVDIEDQKVIKTLSFSRDAIPYGIAVSTDGLYAYITIDGVNQVKEYSLQTYTETNVYNVGSAPTGIAIRADNSRLYITNSADDTVSVIDLINDVVISTITVEAKPKGIAISPDGARIYTANYGADSVSIIDTATDKVISQLYAYNPVSVSIAPDGSRGYIGSASSQSIQQIGGPFMLTVLKNGSGYGEVTSRPEGITCGGKCRAGYSMNSEVTLIAVASDNATFNRWSGDCSGYYDSVTVSLDRSKDCSAVFDTIRTRSSSSSSRSHRGHRTDVDCFIATAAYGSYLDPHVEALRQFRDDYLLTNSAGTGFVEWYYENSPPLADFISQHDELRQLTRVLLTPLVYGVIYPQSTLMLIAGFTLLLMYRRRTRC